MSEHMFRRPAKALTLPKRRCGRPDPLAVGACRPGPITRARSSAATWWLAADARAAIHYRRSRKTPRRARPRIQPFGSRATAAPRGERHLRQQFRNEFGAIIRPTGGAHLVPSRGAGCRGARGGGGASAIESSGSRAALVAIRSRHGRFCSRWSVAPTTAAARSIAPRSKRQARSAFKPLVYTAALAHEVIHRVHAVGSAKRPRPANPEWSPAERSRRAAEQMTLRAALLESNKPRGQSAAARRSAHGAARRGRRRTRGLARRAVARAGHRPGVAESI